MSTFTVTDAQLDVSETGSGHVVLVMHGLTSSRANQQRLGLDVARDLGEHHVVAYDARGHGRSSGRAVPADYTWSALARDAMAIADTYSPDQPVDAIGASMGTGTILHAVTTSPDRFRKLVLVIPPTAWQTRPAQVTTYQDGAELIERRGLAAFVALGRDRPRPPVVADRGYQAPDFIEQLAPSILRGAGLSDLPLPDAIGEISCPTLILAWDGDPGHPVATAERLNDLLPHSTLFIATSPADLDNWPRLVADHLRG